MKRRHLEMLLSSLEDIEEARADLEQYRTPSKIVCDMLFEAYARDDLEGRTVMELGCGGAPFAIGASILGASKVYGIDIDPSSLELAERNIITAERRSKMSHDIKLIEADISDDDTVLPSVYTIFMNPPFGAQKKHADRPFIEKAYASADVIYSIHNANSVEFLRKLCRSLGADMEVLFKAGMVLPRRYWFHRREKWTIEVVIVRYKESS
ncbi:MAG: METTL5 family protein [Thermoplasmatota archaeon]